MATELYKVVFRGEILPGKPVDVVKQTLAATFTLTPDQTALCFSGKPCRLTKQPVDYATALKYQQVFERAGAVCHLVPLEAKAPASEESAPVQAGKQAPPPESPAASPPAPKIEPPPLPDVPPPMPEPPAPPPRPAPKAARASKKTSGSKLWILAIVLPLAFVFVGGIIAAIAVPNLLTAIQRSKRSRTMADMRAVATGLGRFQVETNTFPVTDGWEYFSSDILSTDYYDGIAYDAWGGWFLYSSDGANYRLVSYGKDMQKGGSGTFDKDLIIQNGAFVE